jgi:hypothetical protein
MKPMNATKLVIAASIIALAGVAATPGVAATDDYSVVDCVQGIDASLNCGTSSLVAEASECVGKIAPTPQPERIQPECVQDH